MSQTFLLNNLGPFFPDQSLSFTMTMLGRSPWLGQGTQLQQAQGRPAHPGQHLTPTRLLPQQGKQGFHKGGWPHLLGTLVSFAPVPTVLKTFMPIPTGGLARSPLPTWVLSNL